MVLDHLKATMKKLRRDPRFWIFGASAAFFWRNYKNICDARFALAAYRHLDVQNMPGDMDGAVEFSFTAFGGLFRPIQIRYEIAELCYRLKEMSPEGLVEIGTAKGGSLLLFCQFASPNANIVSVDLPGGWYGGGFPFWKAPLYRRFARSRQKLHFIRGNSHGPKTYEAVNTALGRQQIDFLFIDGDHSYEGIKRDFETYKGLVRPGGIIALHDILPNRYDPDIQVARFWREISGRYKMEEIVQDRGQGNCGIGVIYAPSSWEYP